MDITGIGGLIVLIADIYAIIMILQSPAKSRKAGLGFSGISAASDRPGYLVPCRTR
jgi:hypothetical protein